MKSLKMLLSLLLIGLCADLAVAQTMETRDMEHRIDLLLHQMTLEEKVGQLVQYNYGDVKNPEQLVRRGRIGSFLNPPADAGEVNDLQKIAVEGSRLGIPLILGFDVIHGYKTIFPIPLAEAAAWDPELSEQAARIAATEATAEGIRWTFAPMVDIARDARWGRIAEGAGEDPFLGSALAQARVRGFQGEDLSDPQSVAACLKHYVAYGAAEEGRDYNSVDISTRTLREVYLPPFHAGVEAGAVTLMSAFNDLNGTPASANWFTLTKVLRQEWGFQGFVVSDWNSVGELLNHGVAGTPAEAGAKAITAGVDMDMVSGIYADHLVELVRNGTIPVSVVVRAVRRVLRVKYALNLFDNPYTDTRRAGREILNPEHVNFARKAGTESIVLLKNERHLLPLDKSVGSLAVIGPLADSPYDMLGSWHARGNPEDAVTVISGIQHTVSPDTKIRYARGCPITGDSTAGIAEAVDAAAVSDVALLVVGEGADMSGEAGSRARIDLPGVQEQLVRAVVNTGTPVVLMLVNGRPLALPWEAEHVPAILETWQLGIQHGNAVADVVFGDHNPSGKLPVTFPRATGQEPLYYNHERTGRPPQAENKFSSKFIDIPIGPQYPFGYGLSYTTFKYSNLQLDQSSIGPGGTLTVQADVTNTGDRPGEEIAQLYIQDVVASLSPPVKELQGFSKISLKPGETRTVTFTLGPKNLGMYNQEMKDVVEPGEFKVWVGPNSTAGLEGAFQVVRR